MNKEDKKFLIIMIILLTMFFSAIFIATINKRIVDSDYIQNLEEKLNIYESKYDEHCLEDSIRQVE